MVNYDKGLGRLRMNKLSYGKEYKEIYYVLINSIKEYPIDIAPSLLNEIIIAILEDFPGIFWFEGKWKLEMDAEHRKLFVPIYNMNRRDIEYAKESISYTVKSLDDRLINAGKKDIAKVLYQWIAQNIEYGVSEGEGQNIHNALIEKKAFCKVLPQR